MSDSHLGEQLMQAASDAEEERSLALLSRGAVADYVAIIGDMTPLMMAAQSGLPRLARALLEQGADPRRVDKKGRGALRYGAPLGHPEIFELLAGKAPCGPDIYAETPLCVAAAAGRAEATRALIPWSNIESAIRGGWTAAGLAAANGRPECLRALLLAGARRDAKAENGETLLMAAARGGSVACVRLVFDEKSAEETSAAGESALQIALDNDNHAAADWLAMRTPLSARAQKALAERDQRLPGLLAWGLAQSLGQIAFAGQSKPEKGAERSDGAKRL